MAKRKQDKRRKPRKQTRVQRSSGRSPFPPGVKLAIMPTVCTDGRIPKAAQPRPTELTFLHIWVLTQDREFSSQQEVELFLSPYMTPGEKPDFPEPTQPWHKAQNLAYGGWEQNSPRRRSQVARKALDLSPYAVDAYLLLAHDAASWEETAQLCAQAVTAAEHLLGPDPLATYEGGGFWGAAITRPYMRARLALGYALWRQGERSDAQAHFEDLLRLNPGDNQGVRYLLVAVLLEQGKDAQARRIMDRYPSDALSHWTYNRALWQFRRHGDHPAAQKQLSRAVSLNPYAPTLLQGEQAVHSWELQMVEPGDQSEAQEYVQLYRDAWAMTPGALEWLGRLTPYPR